MKAVKRNKILLVVALTLVLSLTVGLTLAYFSDYTEAKGGKTVTLGGRTEIHETPHENSKDITIENTGETDVMVRVAVYGPSKIEYEDVEGWTDGKDGYWYYDYVLPVGKTTEATLTAKWTVPKDQAGDYNVVITQESEMVVYNSTGGIETPTTDPAWKIVPAAN